MKHETFSMMSEQIHLSKSFLSIYIETINTPSDIIGIFHFAKRRLYCTRLRRSGCFPNCFRISILISMPDCIVRRSAFATAKVHQLTSQMRIFVVYNSVYDMCIATRMSKLITILNAHIAGLISLHIRSEKLSDRAILWIPLNNNGRHPHCLCYERLITQNTGE